jgi:hypothetical protein
MIVLTVLGFTVGAVWIAVDHVPTFGPWLVDTGRKVVGDRVVANLEDWAYGVEDACNRLWRRGEVPQPQWELPSSAPVAPEPSITSSTAPAFRPAEVGPVHEQFAARGDGQWIAVPDLRRPDDPPIMYKTLLHPDEDRAWAEVFVVAIDRTRTRLRLVAGTVDPEATTAAGRAFARPGLVPSEDQADVVAAFNGGFKTEHGHFGMRVGSVTLIPPRDDSCTVAAYDDDTIQIGVWTAIAPSEPRMLWWRQTPRCLVERRELHPELAADTTTRWGASVSGETVIRRSAIGLSEHGEVLFMGVSKSTTARAIALGMRHAGAWDAAQLDVNWSYPKFLVFRAGESGSLEAVGVFPEFVFQKDEYLHQPAPKDFFYIVRR